MANRSLIAAPDSAILGTKPSAGLVAINSPKSCSECLAAQHNLQLPQSRTVAGVLAEATKAGLGQHDMAAVIELLRTTHKAPD